jgi:N-acetylmuramoyl-L-alanine amidase
LSGFGRVFLTIVGALAAGLVLAGWQAGSQTYTVIAANGRHALPFRSASTTDLVPLDQVASLFDLRIQEDSVTGGLAVLARGQRIVVTPGQSLASVSGRIVSLSGAVVRDGQTLFVPIDFLSRAIGPATGQRIDVRRATHLVIVGDVRVPQVATRFERQGTNGRLTLDIQPPVSVRVARDGARLVIRFEAEAIDAGQVAGAQPDFVGAARVDGGTLAIDLGPSSSNFRADDSDPAHVTIDLIAAASAPAAAAPRGGAPPPQEPPAAIDLTPSTGVRTIVIDPGHGGEDAGVKGVSGTVEKDVTLQIARRLKAAIESRLGLRVLLTREGDETLSVDRRTALANNNKADLLISLHANAALRPAMRGAQVLSLSLDDYKDRARGLGAGVPVPVVGGGTRVIEAVPWDLAQIPFAARSAALASIVARHLSEQKVPLYPRATDQAPLRLLAGANMPAVLVELGFLTNADDEHALTGAEVPNAIVEALVSTVLEVRNGSVAGATQQ